MTNITRLDAHDRALRTTASALALTHQRLFNQQNFDAALSVAHAEQHLGRARAALKLARETS